MRLAIHGIQVVLVVDGPERPQKRNKITTQGYSFITEKLELLKSSAEILGIPWWQAPGEAEAECAQMQRLGLVDAVWSEDSDTFLFKGTAMFRFHIESGGSKSNTHARLHQMDQIAEKARGMDWRDLVLFAIIVGGDYDPKGLTQCGPKLALEAIRQGFGVSLVRTFEKGDMTSWRQKFKQFLGDQGYNIYPPVGFPSMQLLRDYIKPRVSSEQELRSGLNWSLDVDNAAVRAHITSRYNFSVQENIGWVVHMLLTRRLLSCDRLDGLALEFVKGVSSKASGNIPMSKISFSLAAIMPRHLLENWPVKITKATSRIKPYEHVDRIECNIPDTIAKLALPDLEDMKKLPKPPISTKVPTLPKPHDDTQAAVGKRKRGRPRKDADNMVATRISLIDTDHEKLKKNAGLHPAGLERSPERCVETAPSERTLSSLPFLQDSQTLLHPPQAEHSYGGSSDDEFPEISVLGQQRRTKYVKRAQSLVVTTSNDLTDVTLQNTDHKQRKGSELHFPPGNPNLHGVTAKQHHVTKGPRLSVGKVASAHQQPNRNSKGGSSFSQAIDLTDD